MRLRPVALLVQAACWLTLASAATNISIDDQDPLFLYTGNWTRILGNLDADGGHMMTESSDSYSTITYNFASVYFVAALWPYAVTTNYGIDESPPMTVDMQDHSVPDTGGGSAVVPAGVVGQWTSNVNQDHTIHITVPPGGQFAIVNLFIFEVLDPSDTSSITSSTPTSSSSSSSTTSGAGTMSGAGTSSSVPAGVSSSSFSSGSHGASTTQVRNLAISMAVVGTLLGLLLVFLFWRFCIRHKEKNKNGINMNPFTPHYYPVPTGNMAFITGPDGRGQINDFGVFTTPLRQNPMLAPRNGTIIPFTDSPAPVRFSNVSSDTGIQSKNFQPPQNHLNHYHNTSSSSGLSSSSYTSQTRLSPPPPPPSLPPLLPLRAQQVFQRRLSTPSMISESPPMYTRDSDTSQDSSIMLIGRDYSSSIFDESTMSTPVASSWHGNTNEKRRNYGPSSRRPSNSRLSAGTDLEDPTATPEGNESRNNVWDSGYPQPLRFIPVT